MQQGVETMKSSRFGYALSIYAAFALLTACGGPRSQEGTLPMAGPPGAAQRELVTPLALGDLAQSDYRVIHAFRTDEGNWPNALIKVGKNFFGTTLIGGDNKCGCGLVYELTPSGADYTYTILHVFTGGTGDGAYPDGLNVSSSGALFGTTSEGGGTGCKIEQGHEGCGLLYKLTPSDSGYSYRILFRFKGGSDGGPGGLANNEVVSDKSPLLGVAGGGGGSCDCGLIFKLVSTSSGYNEHVIWRFRNTPGQGTGGATIINGKLYGAAGGTSGVSDYIYRLDGDHITVIHRFRFTKSKIKNGENGGLSTGDAAGNLYGQAGGGFDRCPLTKQLRVDCGVIFELVPHGTKYTERVLHRFVPGADGWNGGVTAFRDGTLYGTTGYGGTNCKGRIGGCGTVFKLSVSTGKETVLYRFTGGTRGAFPGNLIVSSDATVFYGQTFYGGHQNAGAIFRLTR